MPEYERDATQIALLAAYECALATDAAAPPPPGLDPDLAAVARLLARQLGAAAGAENVAPDPAFRVALRRRLEEQASRYPAVPARNAPLANGRYGGGDTAIRQQQRASFGSREVAPTAPAREDTTDVTPADSLRMSQPGKVAPRRPYRAAVATGLGWLGAALVILIVLLATTLLLRGLPRSTPAARPTSLPTVTPLASPTPLALAPTQAPAVATPATPAATAPRWQPTGALAVPRAQHSATRLADGRVLVAGGHTTGGGDGVTAAAELYDPRIGRWLPTGDMVVARFGHRAILLADGRVLVVGGLNYRQFNNTTTAQGAELYDPASGRWSPAAPLPLAFTPAALAVLADGRVLAVSNPDATAGNRTTATLYDPVADRWAAIGNPDLPNVAAAVALRDGGALLLGEVGGENEGVTPALRYDPATGLFAPVAPLPEPRSGYSASLLPDGRVLIVGGTGFHQSGDSILYDSTRLFDPIAGSWSTGAPLTTARATHTAIWLADGRLLVVGGNNQFNPNQTTTAELYDPVTDRWSAAGALIGTARAYFAVAPLADGRAIVAGGDAGFVRSEYLATVELFTPPARSAAPTGPQPTLTLAVRSATPAARGVGDWSSPSAGLFFFGARGYRRGLPPLPDGSAPQAGAQVGSTLLRWQSGGVFPAGMPIYAVAGQPTEDWLAIRDGDQLVVYRRDDDTTALLAGVQVVAGSVASAGATVCPAYGCPSAPPKADPGTVATANRVRIERALQGSLPAGAEIEVRQMGVSGGEGPIDRVATLRAGERVILFLIPAQRQSIGDFSGGDYYWTGPGWLYGFVGEQVVPLGGRAACRPRSTASRRRCARSSRR